MSLRLDDQLCFRLYAAARLVQQRYRPLLDELGLTYPQYLVLLVLWETDGISVTTLGQRLRLDSGTLTPLLKRLESTGVLTRDRSTEDGRVVLVHLTPAGHTLRERAAAVPQQAAHCLDPDRGVDPHALAAQLDALLLALEDC